MPFWKRDCFREPQRVAMHIYAPDENGDWQEWTGTLSVGDIEIGAVELKNYGSDDRAHISASHLLSVHDSADMTSAVATGSGAVAMAVTPGVAARVEQVTIHLSAAGGAGNLTITIDKGAGAAYDVDVLTLDMTAVQNFLWIPPRPIYLGASDHLDLAWPNANARTYGIEVHWSAH